MARKTGSTDLTSGDFLLAHQNMHQGQPSLGRILDLDAQLARNCYRLTVFQDLTLLICGDFGPAAQHQQMV
jgi:hypothetical protein